MKHTDNIMAPKSVIIVSDCSDVAHVEMRLAIKSSFLAAGGKETLPLQIEPMVECEPFSLTQVSFLTRLVAEIAPPGTLIMVIANFIMERTERIIGTLERKSLFFEGTNTGAFGWLIEDMGVRNCFEIHDSGFVPFGGKFVHAPAVGSALAGVPLNELGNPFPIEQIRRHLPSSGEIVYIDNFGNAKIFIRDLGINDRTHVTIEFPDSNVSPIRAVIGVRMMEHPTGTWVLYRGSSLGLYELGQARGRGLLDLPISAGARIRLAPAEEAVGA